jgi:NhaP-type Na+/H+ or K+/H+ antiporter
VPAVLLLLSTGFVLQYVRSTLGIELLPESSLVLQSLGIAGLIFIVLEEALHLKIKREKFSNVNRALYSALSILFITTFVIAAILIYFFGFSLHTALLYAIPLSIMSSAVAIPSIKHLTEAKREFISYETTFSDIFGVLLFNFVTVNEVFSIGSVVGFATGFIVTLIISLIASIFLLWLLGKLGSRIKLVVVFSILLALYSAGKLFHLSPLILILLFGLILGNIDLWKRLLSFVKLSVDAELLEKTQMITSEFSFFIRTLFFVLFGYNIQFAQMLDWTVIEMALAILFAGYFIRGVFLFWILKVKSYVELFVAPRGLITIVLFYSLPTALRSGETIEAVLSLVVLLSIIIMSGSLMFANDKMISSADAG